MRFVTAEEAVAVVKSKDRVFVHSVAAAPQRLIKAMTGRAAELRGVEVVHLHTEGEAPYAKPEYAKSFHTNALFIGANVRDAVATGEADYTPVFLSEVPALFRRGILPLDVTLIHVSPPDRHGYCSLGVSVDATRAAVQAARCVVAQVNPHMPRTHGDGLLHVGEIDYAVETYVNDTAVIRRNPKVTAINSAIEVDVTGQVCADSIGTRLYSGVGGQMDFIRGASLSEGGKPIIALP
jgi:4-hydroxybutyrate CoA-transferase